MATAPLSVTTAQAGKAESATNDAIQTLKATAVDGATVVAESLQGFDDPATNITGVQKLIKAIALGVVRSGVDGSGATITLTGDVTGSGTTNISTVLSTTGVGAGTYTKVTVDTKGRVTAGTSLAATDIPNLDWTKITSGKPTTLSGYGITDAQPKDADLTAIAGLVGTSGFLKKTAADTWTLDVSSYLTQTDGDARYLKLDGTNRMTALAHVDVSAGTVGDFLKATVTSTISNATLLLAGGVSGTRKYLQIWDQEQAARGNLAAYQGIFSAPIGTQPLNITSTTTVTNLNADLLDGLHAVDFVKTDGGTTMTGALRVGTSATTHKVILTHTGTTARSFIGTDANGLFLQSNAYWDGTVWQRDDTTKPSFLIAGHLGNNRVEFRTATAATGAITFQTPFTLAADTQIVNFTQTPTVGGTTVALTGHTHTTGNVSDLNTVGGNPAVTAFYSAFQATNRPPSDNYATGFDFGALATGYRTQLVATSSSTTVPKLYARHNNNTAFGSWYELWHAGNFTPSNYLLLTGGTLTGQLEVDLSAGSSGDGIALKTGAGQQTSSILLRGGTAGTARTLQVWDATAGARGNIAASGGIFSGNISGATASLAAGGDVLKVAGTGAGSHGYITFYPDGTGGSRRGYFGFNANGVLNITLANEYGFSAANDGASALTFLPGSVTKNDALTKTFHGALIKPTLNTGASNTTTTYNALSVDTINTSVTGLTVNLLKLAYGGTQKLYVNKDGNITATGTATFGGLVTNQNGGYKFPDGTIQYTAAAGAGEVLKIIQGSNKRHGDLVQWDANYFTNTPAVIVWGGINTQPQSLWGTTSSGTGSGSYDSTKPIYEECGVSDTTATSVTLRALLKQKGSAPVTQSANADTNKTMTTVSDTTATVALPVVPSTSGQYTNKFTYSITVTAEAAVYDPDTGITTGGTGSADLVLAVDVALDGVTWVNDKWTATYSHVVSNNSTTGTKTTSTGNMNISVDVSVANVTTSTKFRLRVKSFTVLAVSASFTAHYWTTAGAVNTAAAVTYNTAADSYATKTPSTNDYLNYIVFGNGPVNVPLTVTP